MSRSYSRDPSQLPAKKRLSDETAAERSFGPPFLKNRALVEGAVGCVSPLSDAGMSTL